MTLAFATNLARYTAPDFNRLVSIEDAGVLMGVDAGSLRRLCRERLAFEGHAVHVRPPEGGQEKWFIYRSYTPSLHHPDDPRYFPPDLSRYTEKQQNIARCKALCVGRFNESKRRTGGLKREIIPSLVESLGREFPSLTITRKTLYDWSAKYRYPADLVNLVDTRGGDKRHEASPEAWAAFVDLILHPNAPGVAQCWHQVAILSQENGWTWCSEQSCRRNMHHHVSPQQLARVCKPAKYRSGMAPFIAQNPESWRAGELYIGDHKNLDLICRWRGGLIRPWVSVWMDQRTRKVVGWIASDSPNQTTILGALRHALKEPSNMGGPQHVWIDNGKDYCAQLFHGQTQAQRRAKVRPNVDEARAAGILGQLGITAHFAEKYNPNGKARLERWFRTTDNFCKTFDTYTGQKIENKPEQHNEILKNHHKVPTFETVFARFTNFIDGYNHSADHSIEDLSEDGQTLSPNEAFARWCDTRRVMADPAALDLLMVNWQRATTVNRNGIAITLNGQRLHYGQYEVALASFKAMRKADRRPVRISYDPHDLRTIRVFDEQYRFVCVAPMNQVGGLDCRTDTENLATMKRNKALYERSKKHIATYAITSILTPEERLAHAALAVPVAQTSSLQIVQTPVDGQAREMQREEFRQAVGAENLPRRPRHSPFEKLMNKPAPRREREEFRTPHLLERQVEP